MIIGERYGPGNGTIWLDDVRCGGTEASIADCVHRGWGVHDCDHSEDVRLSCGSSPVGNNINDSRLSGRLHNFMYSSTVQHLADIVIADADKSPKKLVN